jgi:hypothetical protein
VRELIWTNISRMLKPRRMRWAGDVARMGENRNPYRVLVGKRKEKNHYEDLDVSARIMFKWISEKQNGVVWTEII